MAKVPISVPYPAMKAAGKGKPKCPECGYRIRGDFANHQKGEHHKSGGKTHRNPN